MMIEIKNWIHTNMDALISSGVINALFWLFPSKNRAIKKIKKVLSKILNYTIRKWLVFIIRYALPIGTIIIMIADPTTKATFRNIASFVIICISFIFNYLIKSIAENTELISGLIAKAQHNDSVHRESINLLFKQTGIDKEIK